MIRIKGHSDCVKLLFTEETSLKEAENVLMNMPEKGFYRDAEICIDYGGITFSYDEEMQFEKIIKNIFGKNASIIKKHRLTKKQIEYSLEDGERLCKTVEKTLRSGEVVRFRGDVIVYGDVNPGACITSGGNITVLGALRGCARVREGGLVYATYMLPSQIRIGNICSYNKKTENVGPAVAMAENGEIILKCL